MALNCPSCGSENVATSRAVYEGGTTLGRSRGGGVGVGFGGAGAGMGGSRNVSHTLAAKRNKPPLVVKSWGKPTAKYEQWLRTWYCYVCGTKFEVVRGP